MAMGQKKGTQKTLLVKGKLDQNLWSQGVFFLTLFTKWIQTDVFQSTLRPLHGPHQELQDHHDRCSSTVEAKLLQGLSAFFHSSHVGLSCYSFLVIQKEHITVWFHLASATWGRNMSVLHMSRVQVFVYLCL